MNLFENDLLFKCSYLLMGGASDFWMLLLGRFLTGVAGGMTAGSIPVGYHRYRNLFIAMQIVLFFVPVTSV